MIDVEVLGVERQPAALPSREVRRLCALSAASMGVEQAHVAIEFVDAERIAQLNGEHRNLVPEWFALAARGGWVLPPHWLPVVLEVSVL